MLMHALLSLSIGICASLHAMDNPDKATSKELWQLKWANSNSLPASFSPLGDKLISFHDDELFVHDAQNGMVISQLEKSTNFYYKGAFNDYFEHKHWSTQGSYFSMNGKSHPNLLYGKDVYRIWDTKTGRIVKKLDFIGLLFLNDKHLLLQSRKDISDEKNKFSCQIFRAYDLSTNEKIYELGEDNCGSPQCSIEPKTGNLYINFDQYPNGCYTKFYNPSSGQELKKFDFYVGPISPDGQFFVSSPDRNVRDKSGKIFLPENLFYQEGHLHFNPSSSRVVAYSILSSEIGDRNLTFIVDIERQTVYTSVENKYKEIGGEKQFPNKDLTHWITTLCNLETKTTTICSHSIEDTHKTPVWQITVSGLINNIKATIFKNFVVASERERIQSQTDQATGKYLIDTTNGHKIEINTPFIMADEDYAYNDLPATCVSSDGKYLTRNEQGIWIMCQIQEK